MSINFNLEFEDTSATFDMGFKDTSTTFDLEFEEGLYNPSDIPLATKEAAGIVIIGDNLLMHNGVLSVDVADAVEADNTKPVSSAAVAVQVGNIKTILQTI